MKEAIANLGVFNLMMIFGIIMLSFFVGSLGYSKAYKVKNRIINEIELEGEWNNSVSQNVENYLADVGYRVDLDVKCPELKIDKADVATISTNSSYKYCVYKITGKKNTSVNVNDVVYYRVMAYMYFDVPIVGDFIRIPVSGESKPFVKLNS